MVAVSISAKRWERTSVNAWRIAKDETWEKKKKKTSSVCQLNPSDLKEISGLWFEGNSSINKTVEKNVSPPRTSLFLHCD